MKFTNEEIRDAIAASSRRQILEDVIEELAIARLTPQQTKTAVELAITGRSTKEIAADFGVSPRTTQSHIAEAYCRTGTANQREFLSAVISKLLESYG